MSGLNLPRNSVGTPQFRDGAVTAAKLHNDAVTSATVRDHSLLAKDFKADQLPRGPRGRQGRRGPQGPAGPAIGLAGGDLTGSYPNPSIAPGAITNSKLATPAVTMIPGTGLIGGGSIALGGSGTLSVADGGIGATQLADGSVTTAKFAPGAQAPDSAKVDGKQSSDFAPSTTAASGHAATEALGSPTLINVAGNRIFGTCGTDGGSINYTNNTGAAARVLETNATLPAGGSLNFSGDQTATSPRLDMIHVAWGATLANITSVTVYWTGAGGGCEYFAQALTSTG